MRGHVCGLGQGHKKSMFEKKVCIKSWLPWTFSVMREASSVDPMACRGMKVLPASLPSLPTRLMYLPSPG